MLKWNQVGIAENAQVRTLNRIPTPQVFCRISMQIDIECRLASCRKIPAPRAVIRQEPLSQIQPSYIDRTVANRQIFQPLRRCHALQEKRRRGEQTRACGVDSAWGVTGVTRKLVNGLFSMSVYVFPGGVSAHCQATSTIWIRSMFARNSPQFVSGSSKIE